MHPAVTTLILAATLCINGCGWFADDTPPLEEGFHYLFDGKDLAGWRKIGGDATFAVEDGAIVGTHGPGDNTFLRTETTYTDFSLRMQMRWDELGNSGVLFRAQQRGGDGRSEGNKGHFGHAAHAPGAKRIRDLHDHRIDPLRDITDARN